MDSQNRDDEVTPNTTDNTQPPHDTEPASAPPVPDSIAPDEPLTPTFPSDTAEQSTVKNKASALSDTQETPSPETPGESSVPQIHTMPAQAEASHTETGGASSPPPLPPAEPQKKQRRPLVIALIILLIIALCGGAYAAYTFSKKKQTANDEPVKVGVMMAFSGGSSSMGYGAMKGIQLAKKQLGANNIEIVQMDSKCDPKEAAEAIKKLIAQKVVAIIGDGCSSASVAALPAANNSKTIMVSPSSSSPTLSIPDDYFFRVVPPDTLQGSYIAQAIYDKGIRNVAVFYTSEPYGSGMNKVFQEKFEALGGKVVATTTAEPDVITLNNQIQEMKAANPEAIFIAPNSVVSATAVINLAHEAGLNVPLYGADIMYDDTIIKNAPEASEGLIITSFPTGTKSFKQALQNEYKTTEQLYAAPQAYDAFNAIYKAVQKGARSGEDIKKALPGISFEGVSGPISFDMYGDLAGKNYKYDLFQVKNGAFELVQQ